MHAAEGLVSPAAFAQLNGVDGPGDMRLRLYNSIILGAKAMGYWRDCYKGCSEEFQKSVGPADRKPWWPDFPNLRREVDNLLPLTRRSRWTSWSVRIDPPEKVRNGSTLETGMGYHEALWVYLFCPLVEAVTDAPFAKGEAIHIRSADSRRAQASSPIAGVSCQARCGCPGIRGDTVQRAVDIVPHPPKSLGMNYIPGYPRERQQAPSEYS